MEGETIEETAAVVNILVVMFLLFLPLFLNIFTEVYI